ncbi:hypothetical protein Kpol_219p1, partial [Vanderwaltozyma polyspora DSM 70294]
IRIKLENWVPLKTSNELIMPGLGNDELLDIRNYQAKAANPESEVLLEDADENYTFIPNQETINQLSEMGFTENAITRALYYSGNGNTEATMNWLLQHMDDTNLNDPFEVPQKATSKTEVDEESLSNMVAMGLDMKLSKKALILNKGDLNRSVEWVFNNMDDDGELPQADSPSNTENKTCGYNEPGKYKLTSVVCHKGNSVQSGHYVAFIKKEIENVERWVLYNDEKIVIAEDLEELSKNGYIYIYSRVI